MKKSVVYGPNFKLAPLASETTDGKGAPRVLGEGSKRRISLPDALFDTNKAGRAISFVRWLTGKVYEARVISAATAEQVAALGARIEELQAQIQQLRAETKELLAAAIRNKETRPLTVRDCFNPKGD